MPLRAENGAILEAKEPIVLGTDGNPIFIPSDSERSNLGTSGLKSHFRLLQLNSWWAIPLAIVGIGAFLVLGTFFLGIFAIGTALVVLFRFLSKTFNLRV
jgi:hypothetical protein